MTEYVLVPSSDSNAPATATPTTAHNALPGRSAAGAHPAAAVTYDNTTSGLTADTVQEALDELADGGGAVDSVNGETGVVVLDAADVGAVPVGAVGLLPGETNRGAWDIATAYAVGDVVAYDGLGYVALGATTGDQPDVSPGAWDPIDLSTRQVAVGPGSSADGEGAFAVGFVSSAVGEGAFAAGPVSSASGGAAVAVGPGSSASGDGAFAAGPGSSASGGAAVAVGFGSSASGDGAVNLANIVTGTVDVNTAEVTALTLPGGFVDLPETADATNPAADHQRLIARTDGLYVRDETGTEVGPLGAGGGGGIPETIIDAAGDLIVGTAADTAGRLALGTAGQVLTSNGTTAAWAPPPMASISYVSGGIYTLGGPTTVSTLASLTAAGQWRGHPVWLPAGAYAGMSVFVGTAAVSTWRLGIYSGTPDGPTTLIADCGTIATSPTTGQLLASAAFVIPTSGIYWLAALCDAYTATPSTFGWRGNPAEAPNLPFLGAWSAGASGGGRVPFGLVKSGVATGAMPNPAPSAMSITDGVPQIRAHAT